MSTNQPNPYVGPRTFFKEEGHLFFGRDREARDLVALVVSENLVLFYAQSGAGKSSLVNTRLIPSLEDKKYEVLRVGRVGGDAPAGIEVKNIYVSNLIRSLVQQEIDPNLLATLRLKEFLARVCVDKNEYFYEPQNPAGSDQTRANRRALIVDQFEELFSTHPEAWEKRDDFFVQLAEAMEDNPLLWVVLVMREDYIASLDPYAHLLPGGLRTRYYMQRLGTEAALKAIKSPVEKLRPYADGVAEKLVNDLSTIKVRKSNNMLETQAGQYVEPVQLQVVCYSLWQNLSSDGSQITEDDLREVGDVNQSLEKFYDARVSAVAKEKKVEERLIREWFNNELITIAGTRNMVPQGQDQTTAGLDDNVVRALQGDLVRAEMRAGQLWFELSHDRLIEPVQTSNTKWFAANLNFFQQQAALWATQGRPEGMFLRGTELEQAEKDAESKTLTRDERDFLAASRLARERERREKRVNFLLRMLVVGATIALIAAVVLWIQASNSADTARTKEREAVQAQDELQTAVADANNLSTKQEAVSLAGYSQIALGNPDTIRLGQLLAVEAYNTNKPSGDILPGVYQALFDSAAKGSDIILDTQPALSAAFSAGSKHWLVVNNSLRDLEGTQNSKLVKDSDQILQSVFQSDETLSILTKDTTYYSDHYTVHIINTTTQKDKTLALDLDDIAYLSGFEFHLSNNGRWVTGVFGSYGSSVEGTPAMGGVKLWDLLNPSSAPQVFRTKQSHARAAAITEDGTRMALVDEAFLYIFTRATAPEKLEPNFKLDQDSDFENGTLLADAGGGLQFSADGHWLGLLTSNGIRIYDTTGVQKFPGAIPTPDKSAINGFLFSQDNKSIVYVTSSYSYCYYYSSQNCRPSASVWRQSLDSLQQPGDKPKALLDPVEIYTSSTADITAMNISTSGKLAIGDDAGYVRVWDLSQESKDPIIARSVHNGKVILVRVGPDEKTILSAGENDGTRLWKLSENKSVALIVNRTAHTITNAMREDKSEQLLISGMDTNTGTGIIHVYSNVDSPDSLSSTSDTSFKGGQGSLGVFAVSEDWIAAARADSYNDNYFLDFWRRSSGAGSTSLPMQSAVNALTFDPAGKSLAVATASGNLWLYNTADLDAVITSAVTVVENPDQNSGPVEPPNPPKQELQTGLADIQKLLFTANGKYLIVAGTEGVHVWDLQKNSDQYYELPASINPIQISPDQKWLATAGLENTVQVHALEDFPSSPVVISLDQTIVTQLAFSRDSQWLAVATKSGKVLIYELPIVYPITPKYTLQSPASDITELEFNSNSGSDKWLVASSGSALYLWNMRNPKDNPITIQGHSENTSIVYAGFTKDGKWIISVADDQSIQFWSMDLDELVKTACAYAGRNLSIEEWNRYFSARGQRTKTCSDNPLEEENLSFAVGLTPTPFPTPFISEQPTSLPSAPTSTADFIEYTVQSGDALALIAAKYNLPVNTIATDNGITDPSLIYVGQVLKIRVREGSSTSP